MKLYSCFNLSARWGWLVSALPWPLYYWERDPLPIALINYDRLYFDVEFFTENIVYVNLEFWHMLMWNILFVRPVIDKCICPSSWSTYELTTAAAAVTVLLLLLLL